MYKQEIIDHYGTGSAAAKAIGRKHRSCFSNWPDPVHESVAREFAGLTGGKLKYRPEIYRDEDRNKNPPIRSKHGAKPPVADSESDCSVNGGEAA